MTSTCNFFGKTFFLSLQSLLSGSLLLAGQLINSVVLYTEKYKRVQNKSCCKSLELVYLRENMCVCALTIQNLCQKFSYCAFFSGLTPNFVEFSYKLFHSISKLNVKEQINTKILSRKLSMTKKAETHAS